MLVDELRIKTRKAIEEAERKRKAKEAEAKAKSLAEQAEWNIIAHRIIDTIPSIAEKAAEQSLSSVKVMKLKAGRDHEYYPKKLDFDGLKGPAAIVYNYCSLAKLNPRISYDWDSGGIDSWYEIWIDWS